MNSGLRMTDLSAMVRDRIHSDGLTLRGAADESGVSAATLSRVMKGNIPDTGTFASLVRWLNVPADLFIERDNEVSQLGKIEAHLRADRTLPKETAMALAALVKAAYGDFGKMAAERDER